MSKTNSFAGMGKVFKFTLGQNVKSKAFKIVTVIVSLVIIGIFIGINVAGAWDHSTVVQNVYILDETGMVGFDKEALATYDDTTVEGIEDVEFELFEGSKEDLAQKVCEQEAAVGILVEKKDEGLAVTAYVDEEGILVEEDGMGIAQYVSGYYDMLKISNAGLSEEQIMVLFTPIQITDVQIGSDEGMTAAMMKIFAPMVVSLVLYMMLLFYGQTISKSVIAEKDSKLMEYILTSVKSQGLIAGKILAMVTLAIIQMVTWLLSGAIGIVAGHYVGKQINPDYENIIISVIKTLKNELSSAFTWYTAILAFATFILGFIFFSTIAGLIASFVQKTAGLAQAMVIYQYTVVIGFLVSYMGSLMENNTLIKVSNYVPIISPFALPANILIGTLKPVEIVVGIGILMVSTVIVVVLTARVYSAMVLFNGAKVTPKVIKSAFVGR